MAENDNYQPGVQRVGAVPRWMEAILQRGSIPSPAQPSAAPAAPSQQGVLMTAEEIDGQKPPQQTPTFAAPAPAAAAVAAPAPAASPTPAPSPVAAPAPVAAPSPQGQPDYYGMYAEQMKKAEAAQKRLNEAYEGIRAAQQAQQAAAASRPMRAGDFYEQLIRSSSPQRPPTAAEIKERLRRERGQKTMAAVGDGISALANLFGTFGGGLNQYDGGQTLSGRYADMYERLRQERRADDAAYLQQLMSAMQSDDKAAETAYGRDMTAANSRLNNAMAAYKALVGELKAIYGQANSVARSGQSADRNAESEQAHRNSEDLRRETLEETKRTHKANEDLRAQNNANADRNAKERNAEAHRHNTAMENKPAAKKGTTSRLAELKAAQKAAEGKKTEGKKGNSAKPQGNSAKPQSKPAKPQSKPAPAKKAEEKPKKAKRNVGNMMEN